MRLNSNDNSIMKLNRLLFLNEFVTDDFATDVEGMTIPSTSVAFLVRSDPLLMYILTAVSF